MRPYPAKTPSGCRFPGEPEISNFQEYGEEPIEMRKDDFKEWWFFSEDSDKPCWSYVGRNPEIDGPEILLPPQELLDKPSKEEIEEYMEYMEWEERRLS